MVENAELSSIESLIQKNNEGQVAGLSAVAEVLSKMEVRLQKQDDEDDAAEAKAKADADDQDDVDAYEKMVKGIAKSVAGLLKQDQPIAELNGDKPKKVSGKSQWPLSSQNTGNSDVSVDSDALDESDTEEVQRPISASGFVEKQDAPFTDEYEEEEEEPAAEEYPMTEEDGPVKDDVDELALMRKQIQGLLKTIEGFENGMHGDVEKATTERLNKMGFREEKGLAGQRLMKKSKNSKPLGNDPSKQIAKSTGGSSTQQVGEQLTKMSWGDLLELKDKVESGETDSIPQEFVGLSS